MVVGPLKALVTAAGTIAGLLLLFNKNTNTTTVSQPVSHDNAGEPGACRNDEKFRHPDTNQITKKKHLNCLKNPDP